MYVELMSCSNSFWEGSITCKTVTPEGNRKLLLIMHVS